MGCTYNLYNSVSSSKSWLTIWHRKDSKYPFSNFKVVTNVRNKKMKKTKKMSISRKSKSVKNMGRKRRKKMIAQKKRKKKLYTLDDGNSFRRRTLHI